MKQAKAKNFILVGAAGYVAPRHMAAIKAIGGDLIAAYDPHDSVGILDTYFPDCEFFTEFERLDRHVEKLRYEGTAINYVSIASPNYLHDAHCRWALRVGADAICEKPLVLNERNLDSLARLENTNRVWTVLQLRLHPKAIEAKAKYATKYHQVNVDYITPRGKWYQYSWKGNVEKSGGLATNIGVHLFDLVVWMFGACISLRIEKRDMNSISGMLLLERADVKWRLSINQDEQKQRAFQIDGENIELSDHFDELHTVVYENILTGNGFGIEDTRQAIRVCEDIRASKEL